MGSMVRGSRFWDRKTPKKGPILAKIDPKNCPNFDQKMAKKHEIPEIPENRPKLAKSRKMAEIPKKGVRVGTFPKYAKSTETLPH